MNIKRQVEVAAAAAAAEKAGVVPTLTEGQTTDRRQGMKTEAEIRDMRQGLIKNRNLVLSSDRKVELTEQINVLDWVLDETGETT